MTNVCVLDYTWWCDPYFLTVTLSFGARAWSLTCRNIYSIKSKLNISSLNHMTWPKGPRKKATEKVRNCDLMKCSQTMKQLRHGFEKNICGNKPKCPRCGNANIPKKRTNQCRPRVQVWAMSTSGSLSIFSLAPSVLHTSSGQ